MKLLLFIYGHIPSINGVPTISNYLTNLKLGAIIQRINSDFSRFPPLSLIYIKKCKNVTYIHIIRGGVVMRWDYGTIYKEYGNQNILVKRKFARVTFKSAFIAYWDRTSSTLVLWRVHGACLLKQVGLDFEEFRYICAILTTTPIERRNYLISTEDNNAYQSNIKLLELKNKCVAYLKKHLMIFLC